MFAFEDLTTPDGKEKWGSWTEYRLEISGLDYGFVTHRAMERTTSEGVQIVRGLLRESLSFNYNLRMSEARITASSMKFRIVDHKGKATEAFVRLPTKETALAETVNAGSTTIKVESVNGWNAGDVFWMGSEAVYIGAIHTGNKQFLGCTRGYFGSIAQGHFLDTRYGGLSRPAVYDAPIHLDGRRARLFAYSRGEDLQGDGTQIWQGILNKEVSLTDAMTYEIAAYPITELLKTEIGSNWGEYGIRGIYFSSLNPWVAILYEHHDGDVPEYYDNDGTKTEARIRVEGFYRDWHEVCDMANEQLEVSVVGAWTTSPRFTIDQGRLCLMFSGSGKSMFVQTHGGFQNRTADDDGDPYYTIADELRFKRDGVYPQSIWESSDIVDDGWKGNTGDVVEDWYVIPTLATELPTAMAQNLSSDAAIGRYGAEGGTNPPHRFYLNAPNPPESFDTVALVSEDLGTFRSVGVPEVDIDTRSVTSQFAYSGDIQIIRDEEVTLRFGTRISLSSSVHGFLERLTELSPDFANEGAYPLIVASDVDLTGIQRTLSASSAPPFALERNYEFFDDGFDLEEMFAAECQLVGCVPSITKDGKITLQRLGFATLSETTQAQIGPGDIDRKSFARMNRGREDLLNIGVLRTDYDFRNQEYMNSVTVRYLDSLGLSGRSKSLEIEPKSTETRRIDRGDIESILYKPLFVFGRPLTEIQVTVNFSKFGLSIGDVVSITNIQLPSPVTRRRGIDDIAGIVVAVNWHLGTGRGEYTIVTTDDLFRGYTPAARVQTGFLSGTNGYVLICEDAGYSVDPDVGFFNEGETVEISLRDSWEHISVTGSVNRVFGPTVELEISEAIPPEFGADFANTILGYPRSGSAGMSDYQKRYCFITNTAELNPDSPRFGP